MLLIFYFYCYIDFMWYSNEILPIISNMLPRLPKKRPMIKKISSCDINFPSTTNVTTIHTPVVSRTEMYELDECMWTETNELETGVDSNIFQIEHQYKLSNRNEQDDLQDYEYL